MLWKVIQALEERAEYSQLGRNHWKATYRGFVTLSAEGTDPRDAQDNLAEAFDVHLANFIRATYRRVAMDPDVVVQEVGQRLVKQATNAAAPPKNDAKEPGGSPQRKGSSSKKTLRLRKRR